MATIKTIKGHEKKERNTMPSSEKQTIASTWCVDKNRPRHSENKVRWHMTRSSRNMTARYLQVGVGKPPQQFLNVPILA